MCGWQAGTAVQLCADQAGCETRKLCNSVVQFGLTFDGENKQCRCEKAGD